jgi:hypothetical protein
MKDGKNSSDCLTLASSRTGAYVECLDNELFMAANNLRKIRTHS